ncbi:ATP-binding cassette domain-containing protein [Spirillospora sp. NPDC048824]|uniref:ATP-binding cassette domain-containing protein n=1 Tax=Spirillospora sp. NPDC048824 TaxID=3364526 RepID=UPI0037196B28
MTTALTTSGLTKRYGSLVAVDGLDLHVRTGEVYGFLGPNGAGKTTTLRMLLGLVRPTAGSLSVLGGRPRRCWTGWTHSRRGCPAARRGRPPRASSSAAATCELHRRPGRRTDGFRGGRDAAAGIVTGPIGYGVDPAGRIGRRGRP